MPQVEHSYMFPNESGQNSPLITIRIILGLAFLAALYWTSQVNYLLFHSVVEGFSTLIAFAIFIQGWHARRYMENGFLVFLGIAYLFVGWFDFLHAMAYKGMGVFHSEGPNLPTQLWISARYLESLSILTAVVFIKRRIPAYATLLAYGCISALLISCIFYWDIFPDCYLENIGLTTFKILSEYLFCVIFAGGLLLINIGGKSLDPEVRKLVSYAIVLKILSELAFSHYINVFGYMNLFGHIAKLFSVYIIYKALVITSLIRPFDIIFRELKDKDLKLEEDMAIIKSLEKDRNVILSMLVHDMKTPLISIKGFAYLLLKKNGLNDPIKRQQYTEVIYNQCIHLENLLHDFLTSSRSGEHKLVLNREEWDLHEIVNEIANSFTGRCKENDIEIRVQFQEPTTITYLDRTRINRALNNLIDNAIRYSPQYGNIFIRVSTDSHWCLIDIEDQGPGIPEDQLPHIFTPFYRGSTQKDSNSYGLGLAGVKTIVESHDGSIDVIVGKSGGTTFRIKLPI